MQRQFLKFILASQMPDYGAVCFYPFTEAKGIGRRRSQLTFLNLASHALEMLARNRQAFLKTSSPSRDPIYVLPTTWIGGEEDGNYSEEDKWLVNFSRALEDALATSQAIPLDIAIEIPEGLADASALQRLFDAAGRYGDFKGVGEFTLAYPGGFPPDFQQHISDAITRSFGEDTQILISEEPVEAGSEAKASKKQSATDAMQEHQIDRDQQSKISEMAGRVTAAEEQEGSPQIAETAPYYPDDPAHIDQLNRKSVAEALATIIDGVWKGADQRKHDKSFIAHLHGPWGSGKTSILHFLEHLLTKEKLPVDEPPDRQPSGEEHPWMVVHFNAWRMHDQGPPWWTLIDTVYRKAISDPKTVDSGHVWFQHFGWRFRHGWLLSAAQIAVMAVAILIVALGPTEGGFADLLKGSAGVAGVISALFFLKGEGGLLNNKASQRFRELSEDPIGPLTRRFEGLIRDIGRPVAIFVDDLDRCDAAYVVDLLTQIQTLFRKASVLYVVAGDRNWICSSYEQTYEDFGDKIAAPGHSLGHMFLEKIFQISVEVPEITEDQREAFLGHLLQADEKVKSEDLKAARAAADRDLATAQTEAEVIAKNDAYQGTPAQKAVYSAKALEVLHRPNLARERQKHILLNYADYLEPNPRAMKRLLNAYGFRRGYDIQAAERSDQDALIRWTIIENRWPVMANYLSGKTVTDAERKALVALKDDPRLRAIFDDVDWTKLAILKDVQARFDGLTPPPKAA